MKTIAYVRVSTSKQVDNGCSLEAQEVAIKEYVSLHNKTCGSGEEIGELVILRDEGISGKNLSGRPGMLKLLEMVEEGEVSGVIVYALDRLSRKALDILTVLDRFKALGVTFHSITQKWDTSTAMGEFGLGLFASLAQMQRRLIGESTSAALRATKRVTSTENGALRHRKRTKKLGIGRAPYGYQWVGEERFKDLVEDPGEMAVVKVIRRWYKAGHGYRIITQKLKTAGHASRSGKAWHPAQIGRIVLRGYI